MRKAKVVEWCGRLRSHLLHRQQATPEEVADAWPADCGCVRDVEPCDKCRREGTKDDWWRTHGHLRFMQGKASGGGTDRDLADEELRKAQAEDPKPVTVWVEDARGEPERVRLKAYPKSMAALMRFADRDWCVQWLLWRREVLRQAMTEDELDRDQTPRPRELLDRASEEIGRQLAVLVYAATRPGPSVDWDDAENPPDKFMRMSTMAVARVWTAFWEVNVGRVALADHLVQPKAGGRPDASGQESGRMTWSAFGATYAQKMKMAPKEMMHDVSLAAALAQVKLSQPGVEDELEAMA